MNLRTLQVLMCTAALTLLIAALSRAPYSPPGADSALLRFSWRLSVKSQEDCRPRTPAELDALPIHMRTPELCTRDRSDYALVSRIDSLAADTVSLIRGGAKGDRPLFVLEERTLSPGRHHVEVYLQRSSGAGVETLLSLDTVLILKRGEVQLVTAHGDSRRLVIMSSVRR